MSDLFKESVENNIRVENYEDFIKKKFNPLNQSPPSKIYCSGNTIVAEPIQ